MKTYSELITESDDNFTSDKSWQKKAAKSLNNELKKIIGVDPKIKIIYDARLLIKSADIGSSMKPKMFKNLWVTEWPAPYFDADNNVIHVSVGYAYKHFDGGSNVSNIGTFTIDSSGKITDKRIDVK